MMMSLLSTCRSTAPAPARMMTSAVPFLILFLAGVSFAERYWVNFGARRSFGANAAWLRLAVIAYKVITALKRLALPAELLAARPKRLRFLIFNTAGRLVHHARRMVLRLATKVGRLAEWLEAMRLLPIRV